MPMDDIILRSLSYGVYIVTSMDGDRPCGCTANSVMQITSNPQTIAASINRNNYTNELIKKTGKIAVSILAEDSEPSLIGGFGFRSGRDNDKFDGVDYEMKDGLPIIKDSCGYITMEVKDSVETSTHTIFICEMIGGEAFGERAPMTYAYYHAVVKGKTAQNAPTYNPKLDSGEGESATPAEKAVNAGKVMADASSGKKWVCTICGYVYEGETPFEDLPDDWTCPLCGVPKSAFELK